MTTTYQVLHIAGYWRLLKNRAMVGTYYSRESARAAMTIEKMKEKIKCKKN